jgi:hypothetical protein
MMKLSHVGYNVFGDDARRKGTRSVFTTCESFFGQSWYEKRATWRYASPFAKYETAIMLRKFHFYSLEHTSIA